MRRDLEEPVYMQIARQIRGWIASGRLGPGSLLPPVRTVASDLGVNLNTVARAYRSLEEEGFLLIRDRFGAEVAPPATEPAARDARDLKDELRELLRRMRQAGISPEELRRLVSGEAGSLVRRADGRGRSRGEEEDA